MARVLKMPKAAHLRHCPICNSEQLVQFARIKLNSSEGVQTYSYRYRCEKGHTFIVTEEETRAAAAGE